MKRFIPLLAIGLVFLAACSKSSTDSADPNSLFAYVSVDEPLANALTKAYKEETGVDVKFVRLSTGEASARIEAEKNNPQASIWVGGVGLGHATLKHKGLSVPHKSVALEKIPAEFRDPEGYWNGLYVGTLIFAANKNRLKELKLEMPTSWEDLLKPEWKGRIQIPNPGTSGTAYNLLSMLITQHGEQKAFEYMKKLHQNISQYTRSGSAPAKNVAIGESVLALGYAHDILRLIHESSAPIQISSPKDGTGFEIAAVSLIKNGKNLEAAKKFHDWLHGKTAAQIFANAFIVPFDTDGVNLKEHSIKPSSMKLIPIDADWAGKERPRLVEKWNDEING